jgi:hypothetical protein
MIKPEGVMLILQGIRFSEKKQAGPRMSNGPAIADLHTGMCKNGNPPGCTETSSDGCCRIHHGGRTRRDSIHLRFKSCW